MVRTADSLRACEQMYDDSLSLAQAYETLSSFNGPLLSTINAQLSTDYAHSCYHYGRLLREKDDPVTAMQVFINATHSRTRDYYILGRIYSNMGDLCHLAGEFQLAYDMYERSADAYLYNGDTLLYYYDLNNMAFELAEQEKKEETLSLLSKIDAKNSNISAKILETKIILYKNLRQYDAVLSCADSLNFYNYTEPTLYISKAQAFCYLNQYDSATYYANRTIEKSNNLYHLNNAYYILIHCDSINNRMQVYTLSADRADVQKQIEIRQGKLSQAVQLLEQDLVRMPDLRWLYATIATLIIITCIIGIYVYRKSLLSTKNGRLNIKS